MCFQVVPKVYALIRVLESCQSVYLISLVVSTHGRPQASIAAIFRQSTR